MHLLTKKCKTIRVFNNNNDDINSNNNDCDDDNSNINDDDDNCDNNNKGNGNNNDKNTNNYKNSINGKTMTMALPKQARRTRSKVKTFQPL